MRSSTGSLRAVVGLRLGAEVEAVTVDSEGEHSLVPHLPAATWDKLLSNLARAKDQQHDLLTRWEEMVNLAAVTLGEDGEIVLTGMPLVAEATRPADVTVTVEFVGPFSNERLGVSTKFKPFHRADPVIAEAALRALWDWSVLESPDEYPQMIENLLLQCEYYRRVGPPGLRDIGHAPYYAATQDSSRHRTEEPVTPSPEMDEGSATTDFIREWLESGNWLSNSALAESLPDVFDEEDDQHFFVDAFERTAEKWNELYDPAIVDTDTEAALRLMLSRVAESPAQGPPIPDYDDRLSKLLVTGLGGFVWRLAEREAGRSVGGENERIDEAIGSFQSDAFFDSLGVSDRQAVLYQVSATCISLKIPLWHSSPGYIAWGINLFRAGSRWVIDQTPFPTDGLSEADLFYAFYFGAALFHVVDRLDQPGTPRPGDLIGPEWEHCEVVIRHDPPVFVAEAEGGRGRYDAATSRKLPRFKHRMLEGRDYKKLEARHKDLIGSLERDGWVRSESTGEHWYSIRFRRRLGG